MIDLARARRDTPGCETVLHFNNAGASLMPRPVLDAVVRHLELEARIGGYEAADQRQAQIDAVYASAARLVGASADEIALVESATRAWQMAFYSLPLRPRDRVLTGMNEYGSNYIAFLQQARRTGCVVDVVPNDEHGRLSVDALQGMLDERVKLVAVTHVPTNGGLVNPAADIGRVVRHARARGLDVLYLLDTCQSVGQMPIDVAAIGCDMLSATGRKFLRAPRGTGFLYVRRDLIPRLEPFVLDDESAHWAARDRYAVRADARRFENFERSIAGILGLGAAIDYAMSWGVHITYARLAALAVSLRNLLAQIPGVVVRDLGLERCGIVTFTADGHDPEEVKRALAARRINVSVTRVSSTRLDMEARGLAAMVRASVHYYNTEEEVERFVAAVREILR
ncbi:MAG TPA: aminotransferase class V-fold PLP-dependent enzyme [Thermodesulfobacteriota bacterium]